MRENISEVEGSEESVSRRNVLKSVGVGFAGLTGQSLTPFRKNRDTVTIPRYVRRGEVIAWREVDSEWWEHVQRSKNIADRLATEYLTDSRVTGLGRPTDDRKIGDMFANKITVYLKPEYGIQSDPLNVPDEIDGISIELRKDPRSLDTANYYDRDFDPVIGGVIMSGPPGRSASLTCKVEHNGVMHMMSARHPFIEDPNVNLRRCSTEDITGKKAYQNGDFYGKVKHHWNGHDVALSERNSYFGNRDEFEDEIVEQDGVIEGFVTQEQLEALKGDYTTVHKRGIATGATTGEVISTGNYLTCGNGNYMKNVFKVSNSQFPGDSGGPVYDYKGGGIYMIGLATQDDENRYAQGSAAWWINQNHNVIFCTYI